MSLAEQGYFDDTTCHRLTTKGIFVLQCGDPTATGSGGPGYSFEDELDGSEKYPAGTIAMANAGPDTNGSQFFLVYEDTELPPSYTTFGTIDDAGLDVVEEVADAGVRVAPRTARRRPRSPSSPPTRRLTAQPPGEPVVERRAELDRTSDRAQPVAGLRHGRGSTARAASPSSPAGNRTSSVTDRLTRWLPSLVAHLVAARGHRERSAPRACG